MIKIAKEDVTNFPNDGDNKKISLKNSKFKQFDYGFAKRIKEEHNDIFNAGGNEYGDTAFLNWGKVRDGQMTDNLEEWIVRRERFMERHEKDKRLAGVVAVMKWGGIVSRGEQYMKDLIREEIDKDSDKGGDRVQGKDKKLVDIKEFKSRLSNDKSTEDVAIRKQFNVEVKAIDEDNRVLRFIASTKARDRDGDTIDPTGWVLDDFIKNPVFLWAHDYSTAPLGKVINYEVNDKALIEDVEFIDPKEMYPDVDYSDLPEHVKFADMVYRMYKNGVLNAVSVGFDPKEYEYSQDKGGNVDFYIQSQLELSGVPVPSNQEALRVAGMKGIDKELMTKWAKSVLKSCDDDKESDSEKKELELSTNKRYIAGSFEDMAHNAVLDYFDYEEGEVWLWIEAIFSDYFIVQVETKAMMDEEDYICTMYQFNYSMNDGVMAIEGEPIEVEMESTIVPAKQNKQANQSSLVDDFLIEIKELTKAGRTLSSANEDRLRKAKDMLEQVLDQLDNDKSIDKGFVFELVDKSPEEDLIEVEEEDIIEMAQKVITNSTGKIF